MAIVAILLVSFAWDIGGHNNVAAFTTMLVGVIFIGMSCSYGGSVFLGYMERMPSWQISSWSSGTGLSGVAASLIFLGLTSAGMNNAQIFLLSITVVVIYWLMFFFGLKIPFCVPVSSASATEENEVRSDPFREVDEAEGSDYVCKSMTNWKGVPWTSIVPARSEAEPECLREMRRVRRAAAAGEGRETVVEETEEGGGADLGGWARWKRDVWPLVKEMHQFTLWNNMNLAVVYVAEYAVQFMVPFSFPCAQVKTDNSFWLKNSFVITQFCYQFGVLISRSSLLCIRVRRIWIMSVIQVINAIAWFLQAKLKYVSDPNDASREVKLAFVLFAWMIFVGLMGGASYVNVFYNILEETRATQEYEVDEAIEFIASRRRSGSYANAEKAKDEQREVGVVEGESKEAREATHYISTVWKEKRDLAMNIGSVYSSIGIALGSLLDLLFTLVVLKGDECT
ncbi:hypothetical protein TRSC58_06359 [Trypanosoma rangeli SC58]|nr:hypothetical protein TRSC58_06359 [Trypanosoma rangeli SC58]